MAVIGREIGLLLKLLFVRLFEKAYRAYVPQGGQSFVAANFWWLLGGVLLLAVFAYLPEHFRQLRAASGAISVPKETSRRSQAEMKHGWEKKALRWYEQRRIRAPRSAKIVTTSSALLLAIASFSTWPYDAHIILRFFVCVGSIFLAVSGMQNANSGWRWMLAASAVLYNPFLPLHLHREVWSAVNLLSALIFLFLASLIRTKTGFKEEV